MSVTSSYLALAFLSDAPTLLDECVVLVLESHLDDFAAAAETLQNVLDVVRQSGNGLSDGRQTFRLHQGLVVVGFFDGEGGLVCDGDGQRQMIFAEFAEAGLAFGGIFLGKLRIK